MIEKHVLAYTAGYTDGDGCFSITRTQRPNGTFKYRCSFIISSTDKNIIDFFCKNFPGVRRLSDDRVKYTKQKPQYHFIIRGKKSISFIEMIIPFLVEKKEEAIIFCNFIKSNCIEEKEFFMKKIKEVKDSCNLIFESDKKILSEHLNSIIPCELDFAYFAGFIDAECSLGIFRSKTKTNPNFVYKMLIQCGNTKLPIFKWIMSRFGGRVHFVERRSKNINHRDFFTWRLCSKSLANILPNIFPYLKYKQPVCAELIKYYETNTPIHGNISRNSPKFKEFYSEILVKRDIIFHKVHQLNQRGINNI